MFLRIVVICFAATVGAVVGWIMAFAYVDVVHGYDHGFGETQWALLICVPLFALISVATPLLYFPRR